MTPPLDRRKAVMGRSRKLGHCVCNPRQPCPCEALIRFNVCSCAGEKMPRKTAAAPLTRLVRKAGCASKIGQADLLEILKNLPPVEDPRVLLGAAAGDDAGIYDLDGTLALVQTVDVFTPCVDDPHLFGQIAAANSLSDVYAMGGRPLTALSIVGFPIDDLDGSLLQAMLEGGMQKLAEAGCALIGGHSMNDEEPKCGFAVTGLIDRSKVIARDRARVGDALVLTKPIGTGMLSFAAQLGRLSPEALAEMGVVMATLNRDAAECMVRFEAHAATDITGFGLGGHLTAMVRGSRVTAEIDMRRVPVFAGVEECLREELLSGAVERNQEFSMAWIRLPDEEARRSAPLFYDPQTSGGMLIALPEERAAGLVAEMRRRGHAATSIIGRIVANAPGVAEGEVVVVEGRLENFHGARGGLLPPNPALRPAAVDIRALRAQPPAPAEPESEFECCPGGPPALEDEEPVAQAAPAARGPEVTRMAETTPPQGSLSPESVENRFMGFMQAASRAGRIDERTKKLMAVGFSIAHHCEPCLRSHLKGALAMGISREELDEVANLSAAFGGCTSLMFFKETMHKLGQSGG